jgi:malonyl-CoA decarboxylase
MSTSFFEELLNRISGRGRQLLDLSGFGFSQDETIESLSKALLSGRGEASGVAIALQILNAYKGLDENRKAAYFAFLAQEFSPDPAALAEASRLSGLAGW